MSGEVNFIATMRDSDENIVKCDKCDKPASGTIMSNESYIAFCEDHSPFDGYAVQFIYSPPTDQGKLIPSNLIIEDAWTVNLSKRDEK